MLPGRRTMEITNPLKKLIATFPDMTVHSGSDTLHVIDMSSVVLHTRWFTLSDSEYVS